MYIFVVKKWAGQPSPFPLQTLLEEYQRFSHKQNFAYCLPGYMGTTFRTIDDFFASFPWKGHSFFQNGMNGYRLVTRGTTSIGSLYNDPSHGDSVLLFNRIFGSDPDHSKTIFFLEGTPAIDETDDLFSAIRKLSQLKADALLLGSSNQSFTSYYSPKADKGEADVLLVSESVIQTDALALQMNESINERLRKNHEENPGSTVSKPLQDPGAGAPDINRLWLKYLSALRESVLKNKTQSHD
jgi:hypothetical protein